MKNSLKRNLLIGGVLFASFGSSYATHAGSKSFGSLSYDFTFWGFPEWSLSGRVSALEDVTAENTTTTTENSIMLEELKATVDSIAETAPVATTVSVFLDVDCSVDPTALVTAYNANVAAKALTFTLTGDCYGDYLTSDALSTNLTLQGSELGAQIIENPVTGSSRLKASGSTLILRNLSVVGAALDDRLISVEKNGTVVISDSQIIGSEGGTTLIRASGSSSLELSNVDLISSSTTSNAIIVTENSAARASNGLRIQGVNRSIDLRQGSSMSFSGEIVLEGELKAVQSHARIFSNSSLTAAEITLESGASMESSQNVTVTSNGRFDIETNASARLRNVIVNNDDLRLRRGSVLRISGSDTSLTINNGSLRIEEGSSVNLSEGFLTGSTALRVTGGSQLSIESDVDDTPFIIAGDTLIESSSVQAEDTIFEGFVSLQFGSSLVVESFDALPFDFNQGEGSFVYLD